MNGHKTGGEPDLRTKKNDERDCSSGKIYGHICNAHEELSNLYRRRCPDAPIFHTVPQNHGHSQHCQWHLNDDSRMASFQGSHFVQRRPRIRACHRNHRLPAAGITLIVRPAAGVSAIPAFDAGSMATVLAKTYPSVALQLISCFSPDFPHTSSESLLCSQLNIHMRNPIIVIGCLFGLTAVLFGAFGAHALKAVLTADQSHIFETGVRYQMYHALALFALAATQEKLEAKYARAAAYLFSVGTLLFSGSLYALCLTNIPITGAVTPIGGLALIGGWLCTIVSAIKSKRH